MITRLLALVFSLLAIGGVRGGSAQGELEEVLRQSERQRQQYVATFRDLTAVETWVTEILKKDGTIDKRRTAVSDFYVYPSRFKGDVVSEYRITRNVDGKPAGNPTARAMKLFRALGKATTQEQEDRALREQNFRHILRFMVFGLTVTPVWVVRSDFRQDFSFAIAGRERLEDRDATVLTYESKALRPVEASTIYKRFKSPRRGGRGRVWLDATDWRIRRWVDDTVITDDEIRDPAVLIHKEIEYESSALGTLPRRISVSLFDKSDEKKPPRSLRLVIRQTFTYDTFKRFDVTTANEIRRPEEK